MASNLTQSWCPAWYEPIRLGLASTWGKHRSDVRNAWLGAMLLYAPLEPILSILMFALDTATKCNPVAAGQIAMCDQRTKFQVLASVMSIVAPIVGIFNPIFFPIAVGYAALFWCMHLLFRFLCNGQLPSVTELTQIPQKVLDAAAGLKAIATYDPQQAGGKGGPGGTEVLAFMVWIAETLGRDPSESEVWNFLDQNGGARPPPPPGTGSPGFTAIQIGGTFQEGVSPGAILKKPPKIDGNTKKTKMSSGKKALGFGAIVTAILVAKGSR